MRIRALFQDMTDSTFTTSTEDALKEAVAGIARRYGFDRFAYLNLDTTSARDIAVSNYPSDWQAIYLSRSYKLIDPVVTISKRIKRAFQWRVGEQRKKASVEERGFWDIASDFGISTGLTVPISVKFGQLAMLTLASPDEMHPEVLREAEYAAAAAAVAFVHARLGGADYPTKQHKPTLTDREVLCMRWMAAGKTMQETAVILGLNFHTVRFDLDNVRAKLKANNIMHALSLCLKLRLI